MRFLVLGVVALGGCATPVPEAQPVKLIGSDFCKIQRTKITWDVKDTRPTVEQIRRFNRKWDSRCGKSRTS